MNLKYFGLLGALLLVNLAYAQNFKGKIVSEIKNEGLSGAHIQVKGGSPTYTDSQGNFELQINESGQLLKVSFMGFETKELLVYPSSETTIISLKESPIPIQGVLVTGQFKDDPVLTMETYDYVKKIVQPRNVADLFQDINGFSLIKRGNYAIDPSFRASQYEQLNVQFDGGTKVMHACPNRMDPITTHVNPEEIEKIEIIKGPYTVRYGATFGGIVNMVTQKPLDGEYGLSGHVNAGYESNGNSMVSSAQVQQANSKYDIRGTFGFRDFGNYKDGDGTEIPSSFRSLEYGARAGYNFSGNQRLQANWRQSYGRDVLHAGLPMDTDEDNSSMLSLDYRLAGLQGLVKNITAKAYYSYVDHVMSNTKRPTFMMTEAISEIDATTAGGKLELKLAPNDKLSIYSGLDFLNIARDGFRTRLVKRNMMGPLPSPMEFVDKVWQDSYINDLGIFVETKYPLSPKTLWTSGIRFDNVTSEIKDPADDFLALYPDLEKRTEHNISATTSIKYATSTEFIMEVAYGRGVRSANMIERVINHFTVGQDPYEYIGNPNLKAEVNNQFEIGFKGRIALSDVNSTRFNYSTSFYYSLYENYIVPVIDKSLTRKYMPANEPVNPKVFQNLDESYKTGFEVMAGFDFWNGFTFNTEMAYVYAKNKDLNESLPLVPPLMSRFKLGYEAEKFWANANYTITSRQENIAPSFGEQVTPGYEVMDVRLGVNLIKNVSLGVAVLNLFDVTYNNHLNFAFNNQANFSRTPINDPGRNFSAFMQYKF
ncbi:TonB-dependent receptor [Maribacter sp. PR1]|uniref:TonB-dependent receptor n=1 Tax=Maribacter cobaltidurans TaxID=1178778 RepID=A0ABU7IVZ0_9FLAO|nr:MULTISPECIES: TonB-dependent receptor [Maribacter]MDC6389308.1 TonB-dependent receptor [Maribacter sp. PR1]MEE1976696.1 TonB-dependent receptor [Maribacter cobaltidurans]